MSTDTPLPITVRLDPAAAPGNVVAALAKLLLARARRLDATPPPARDGQREGGAAAG
jgi:hypothetical protein